MADVAGNQYLGAGGDGGCHQGAARPGTHCGAGNAASRVAGDAHVGHAQGSLHPPGQLLQGARRGEPAGAPVAAHTAGVSQGVQVVGHLLIGVGRLQRCHRPGRQPLRHDDLQAQLLRPLQVADAPQVGVGAALGPEGARAGRLKAAVAVVADHAGAGGSHDVAHGVGVARRHEGDQLAQPLFARRLQHPGLLQAQSRRQHVVGAARGGVKVRVGGVDGDACRQQAVQAPVGRPLQAQVLQRVEDDRMVQEQQVDAAGRCLGDHGIRGLQGDQHSLHGLLWRAQQQAHVVPLRRPGRRCQLFHQPRHVRHRHAHGFTSSSTCASRRCNAACRSCPAALRAPCAACAARARRCAMPSP